jgi:hypothetical protein
MEVQVRIPHFQFTDLEEEFEEFRQKVELEQALKEEEIAELRGLLKAIEQRNKRAGNTDIVQCATNKSATPWNTRSVDSPLPHHF